ncbi:polysaccharide pyruvyl transferase family protein [Vibrio sp. G41H]|uniref:polysaccharide pyruvyl transferase family protein n=1 Tax=unclassified Vibrio TaxID=2614977 RepID=UPI001AD63269|nr:MULTISPECIES: polysaccharide pyruvyl transferase family protein [unclassified Vibrio]MBO7913685.1 polysaccharide pyruvyl transferase family protein [Vibrio sp. G41H]MCF7492620.1 polysaccharide pyruvyl transferase family protein [Vibrio sp. G-C-1]
MCQEKIKRETNYQSWNNLQFSLKNEHAEIARKLHGKSIAYIDYPVHFNVGDLLIYHGTETFFKNNEIIPKYRSDIFNVSSSELEKIDVIVFHGGGNFGDLYPKIHNRRIDIIDNFKDKEIIILPQSIHFEDDENQLNTTRVLSSHPRLTMFVRDVSSYEWASAIIDETFMMPDMAHSLHPLDIGSRKKSNEVLTLRRCDIESNKIEGDINTFDWNDLITKKDRLHAKLYRLLSRLPVSQKLLSKYWYSVTKSIINRSQSHFLRYDIVDTDRLHGLIFANLLGKNVTIRDNSYGKNSKYYKSWLVEFINIKLED